MDTYEKKYKEALEVAKKLYQDCPNGKNDRLYHTTDLEKIFPELAESEEEKIRKEIISFIQDDINEINFMASGDYDERDSEDIKHEEWCKKAIAWLEKQGEQKPQRMISAEAKEAMYDKPACAWSEEDEKMCQETIDWFEKKCFPYALENENPARESIKWLKSLKDRYTWKPSDEQMEALKGVQEGIFRLGILESLYNDLMKLKE